MKLSNWVFVAVGFCLMVIAVSFGLFKYFLPNNRDAATFRAYEQKLRAEGAKMPQAEERVADARVQVEQISASWDDIVARKTPPLAVESGGINLAFDRYTLTVKSKAFRENVQRHVNAQQRRGGVTVISGATVPMPTDDPSTIVATYYNYPASAHPVAIFDLGQITVRGTWDQIKANIRAWSSMPNYLAVADGLQVQGTSPSLTATYNVTLVAFVRGTQISPEILAGVQIAGTQPGQPGQPGQSGPGTVGGPGAAPGPTPPGPPGGPGR